jgi:hypothetical protein
LYVLAYIKRAYHEMIITLMADRYGYQNAIKEVREEWLEDLLLFLGLDIEKMQQSQPEFIKYLFENKVEIIDFPSLGAIRVINEGEVVGEWAGPEMKLKQDKGGLYYEITIECWSIKEEDINLSG